MDNIMTAKALITPEHSSVLSSNDMDGKGTQTKYLDKEYIVRAREAEVKSHLHSISQLQKKMEKLASELAWELEQHHSKIHELYQLEIPFKTDHEGGLERSKTKKKTTTQQKNRPTFDMPLIGDPICESVA